MSTVTEWLAAPGPSWKWFLIACAAVWVAGIIFGQVVFP